MQTCVLLFEETWAFTFLFLKRRMIRDLIELLRQWARGADDQSPEPSCDPISPKTSRRT